MKITEILVENKKLDEGPLLNKIGKGVDTVARGIGAVPGVAVGAGQAIAKGYRAGKAAVAGAGDANRSLPTPNSGDYGQLSKDKNKIWNKTSQAWEPYDQSTGAAPAPANAPAPGSAPANAPGAAPATPAAGQSSDTPAGAGQAAAPPAADTLAGAGQAAAPAASQTMYAQVKASVDKLDKKGKQRILQLLQKSLGAPATAAPPAAAADTGAPVKAGKPTQAEIDADRERIMGPTSDSIIRTAKPISESFSLYRKH